MTTEVKSDKFYFLPNSTLAAPLPVPKTLHNEGNYIISLGNLCRWLAEQAEEMGVEIYPGFSASEFVEGPDGEILGVATSDMGIGKDGKKKDTYAAGPQFSPWVFGFSSTSINVGFYPSCCCTRHRASCKANSASRGCSRLSEPDRNGEIQLEGKLRCTDVRIGVKGGSWFN